MYALWLVLPISIITIFWRLKTQKLPTILTQQLKLLMTWVIVPHWLSDFIQIFPFTFATSWVNSNYTLVSISNILLTFTILYCSRQMLGLRFLNWNTQVQSPIDIYFLEHFKTSLEQFSHATSLRELAHITQRFFNDAFGIPFNRVHLHIRNTNQSKRQLIDEDRQSTIMLLEGFMSTHAAAISAYIKQNKLLVFDELAFSNFYESTPESKAAFALLETIQADILIPIHEKENLIAYIIVDRFARLKNFYASSEYDEMLIFTRYLGNIIYLLQNKNLDTLIKQEKDLQEELYSKHQEINQYKESIRSFMRNNTHKEIGIIFYKNRHFTFGNKAAKDLIQVNPNIQEGHPISKALKQLATQVESYKIPQTHYTKDNEGIKLVLSGVPSLENNNVIISVYYPEITDIIKKQIDTLKDPSEWDYLLYLETTKPGKLINQLIPGSGETLLNFKIELLKTALSKKATLLNMPEQDLQQTVQLLHHISLRETLHTIELNAATNSHDIAINLFGMNALFNINKDSNASLLEKLDGIGTLFIKNIHLLDVEVQEYLAEFLRYGFFRVFKSDTKVASNVRIICSTNQNLATLVQEEKFSKALFQELKYTTLSLPSLATLPENELHTLVEGFSEQAVTDHTYKNLMTLSDKDKHFLAHQRPTSLQELKVKVQDLLIAKSKRNNIYNEAQFDPAYAVSDPELIEAARLGKKALKDQKTMTLLWQKFKNQNKIASFLGVNRSSVNRRCKQFDLM
jgi:transcriptional regulator with GAF, ATPase, and Fis domain